jgi:hypothetical protein
MYTAYMYIFFIIWLFLIHILRHINLKWRKHEDSKIGYIYIPSLSDSKDEISVNMVNLSDPKISNVGQWIINTK